MSEIVERRAHTEMVEWVKSAIRDKLFIPDDGVVDDEYWQEAAVASIAAMRELSPDRASNAFHALGMLFANAGISIAGATVEIKVADRRDEQRLRVAIVQEVQRHAIVSDDPGTLERPAISEVTQMHGVNFTINAKQAAQ